MAIEAVPGFWIGAAVFASLFALLVVSAYRNERRIVRERLREIVPGTADRARALVVEAIRATLLVVDAAQPGFSKLGGRPELPEGTVWPAAYQGSRTFIAQLDLAEFPAGEGPDWLPQRGRLYVFYDPDNNGLADLVSIVSSDDAPGPPAAPPSKPWAEFRERRIAFEPRTSAPSLEWLDVDTRQLEQDYEAFADEMQRLVTAPPETQTQHRVGGYPNEIQFGCLRHECELIARGLPSNTGVDTDLSLASKDWRLLLQVDSETALRMEWHDGGRLYVFIREADARAGDFSKTVTILQSY